MASPPPLRWGILSTANIGRKAVGPAIRTSRTGVLHAVASRSEQAARTYAAELEIPVAYGSYATLLHDPDVDAVYIPLPNSLHRPWTLEALAAGKHVLCEKPLGLNEAECREMAAAARAADRHLMEAFMYRFHPRTQQVVDWLREERLGQLRLIQSTFTFRLSNPSNIRLDPGLGGGALMDVGCYAVNVSRTLTGAEPERVSATARWSDRGVDLGLTGTLHFPGGTVAQIACGLDVERLERVVVAGESGWMELPHAFLPGVEDATVIESRARGSFTAHTVGGVDQYRVMVDHFARCVREDRPVRYGPEEAADNQRVLDALYASARAGGATVELSS